MRLMEGDFNSSNDRTSMPGHLTHHWHADGHVWSLLWTCLKPPVSILAQSLFLDWDTTAAVEWCDLGFVMNADCRLLRVACTLASTDSGRRQGVAHSG
jgi:hypothetical protein